MIPVAEAAKLVGMTRNGIVKAITTGKVSGTKNVHGRWEIDPAELTRVYQPLQPITTNQYPQVSVGEAVQLGQLQTENTLLKSQMEELRSERDDWKQMAQTLGLSAPKNSSSFWDRIIGRSSS